MRYFLLLFLFFSTYSYSQTDGTVPVCAVNIFNGCIHQNNIAVQAASCDASLGQHIIGSDLDCSSWGTTFTPMACKASCVCPEGKKLNRVQQPNGVFLTSCIPDEPTDNSECLPPQVEYAGLCRDTEQNPEDCGSNYPTAVAAGSGYVCTNDENCGDGSNPTILTTANGSWKVCGTPDETPSSSGSNSSPPSSAPSGSDSSSGDNGGGSGSGSGSGNGTGNGSGSSSSSPSDSGSGDGDEGIGNGSAAAANCDDNEPDCDGDPIQCAMLVQLWINNCAGYDEVELSNPVDDNEAIRDNFDALMSSAEPSVNAEGVLDAMTPGGGAGNGTGSGSGSGTGSGNGNGNGGLDLSGLGDAANSGAGGSCPADRSISLGAGNFDISFQFFCDFASQMSGLVILIFSYIGGMIIYRSLQW